MAAYTTKPGSGGSWHVYPGGRKVFVKSSGGGGGGGQTYSGGSDGNDYLNSASYDMGGSPVNAALLNQQALQRQTMALGDALDAHTASQLSNEYGIGDTTNPFSRAKMLQASYDKNVGSNTTNYAKQGQLYSGALQTAQNASLGSYNQGYDKLKRDYEKAQTNLLQSKLNRYASGTEQMSSDQYSSIQNQIGALGK